MYHNTDDHNLKQMKAVGSNYQVLLDLHRPTAGRNAFKSRWETGGKLLNMHSETRREKRGVGHNLNLSQDIDYCDQGCSLFSLAPTGKFWECTSDQLTSPSFHTLFDSLFTIIHRHQHGGRGANQAPIPFPWIFRKNQNCGKEGKIPNSDTIKLLLYPGYKWQSAKIFSNVLTPPGPQVGSWQHPCYHFII